MFEDSIQNYTEALALMTRLKDETLSSVFPVRRIMMHAESYIENQFKAYFEAE